jgi:hypothetical protein
MMMMTVGEMAFREIDAVVVVLLLAVLVVMDTVAEVV